MEKGTKPIPVRMDKPLRNRVQKAGKKLGLTSSAVMRLGVLLVLPQIEAGTIKVPKNT